MLGVSQFQPPGPVRARIMKRVMPRLTGRRVVFVHRFVESIAGPGLDQQRATSNDRGKGAIEQVDQQFPVDGGITNELQRATDGIQPGFDGSTKVRPVQRGDATEHRQDVEPHGILAPVAPEVVSLSVELRPPVFRHHPDRDQIAVDEISELGVQENLGGAAGIEFGSGCRMAGIWWRQGRGHVTGRMVVQDRTIFAGPGFSCG